MELTKLRRERAVDAVYEALRQAILTNGLKPGERLNVDQLAKKLGVSLTPIRGAVQQLATEGLVEIRPRSGTFVASLSGTDIDETFDIRIALECLAAESAVDRITPTDLKRLKELNRLIRKPIKSRDDWESHEKYNSEFHGTLVHASGNRRLEEIYQSVEAQIQIALLRTPDGQWSVRQPEEFANHEAIIEAMESKDKVQVCALLKKHINTVRAAAHQTMQSVS